MRLRKASEAGPVGGAGEPEKLALELEREWLSRRGLQAGAFLTRRRPQGWAGGCEVRARPSPRQG